MFPGLWNGRVVLKTWSGESWKGRDGENAQKERTYKRNTFKFVTMNEIIFLALCRGPMEAVSSNIEIVE